ncbi:MAG: hypothetical protein BWX92_03312 [Deltaproteobacteria bacterium ADurb.Bin135]|nr:MAG: hypothetical protein BWX92_03312 [Deltaproteobacteria bacterium ADurb.Bin135]
MSKNEGLYSTYQRVKGNCCQEWEDSKTFYEWYWRTQEAQKSNCKYCSLPGDTSEHYKKHFRKGKRGVRLEVDRKDNTKPYSPENCVLACYPCNNAKSDVFSSQEFEVIGKIIRMIKMCKKTQ